jgi:site-specific DNA-methyltransferase (adenine-specific)
MNELVLPPEGVYLADSLSLLAQLPTASVDLVYIDPPFNTGKTQRLTALRQSKEGATRRTNFSGEEKFYEIISAHAYGDKQPLGEFLTWLEQNLVEIHRVLKDTGSIFLHLDWHTAHYARVLLDQIFGLENFINEIIWVYDFGARSKKFFARKHDNIFWYSKTAHYTFNYDQVDRIPYLAPGLVGPVKAARGKTVTDTWWQTIVGTNDKNRTHYPTQKPQVLIERIIKVVSNPGELVVDVFSGSGTTAAAAQKLGRRYIVADRNPVAVEITRKRLAAARAGVAFQTYKPNETKE